MSDDRRPRRILRSAGALLAGMFTGIVLSLGTDWLLQAAGVFPPLGQPAGNGALALATIYRSVYGVLGAYITALLAPDRPMQHALQLGLLGLLVSLAGAIATWNKEAIFGPHWYPVALVVLALPTAWLGGKLRVNQWSGARLAS